MGSFALLQASLLVNFSLFLSTSRTREIGQVSKFGDHLKWNPRARQYLTGLINEGWRGVAKEARCLMYMWDAIRFEAHQPSTGGVRGDWIVC